MTPHASLCRAAPRVLLIVAVAAAACTGSAVQAQEPVTVRIGAFAPPGSIFATYWQKFKATAEGNSKGTLKIDLSTNDPNEGNLLSNLRRGRVDCVGASLQGTSTILPEVAVLQLPYLFADFKQVDHAYDSSLQSTYRRLFAAKGVEMLSFVETGFTNMYGTVPIQSPADVKGVKLRATQARASQAWIKATGAEAVVLPIAEAVPGLQTGLIKGGESGIVIYGAFLSKSAPQYTLTAHAFDSGTIMCNKPWFDKLDASQQAALRAGWNAKDQARDTRKLNEAFIEQAAAKGVTIYKPTAAETAQWQAAGKVARDELVAAMSPEARKIHDEILKDLASMK